MKLEIYGNEEIFRPGIGVFTDISRFRSKFSKKKKNSFN